MCFCRFGFWFFIILFCNLASAQQRLFTVVQTMNYKGGVDLTAYGVLHNPIIYERYLLPSKLSDDPVSQTEIKKILDAVPKGPLPIVLDIERWPVGDIDLKRRNSSVAKLVDVLNRVRQARPDLSYGYYGLLPSRTYEPLINPQQEAQRKVWMEYNELSHKDFAPYVDALFPSLYTFDNDAKSWQTYAKGMLAAARRFDKPTYCYLWPQFHPANKELAGQYLSRQLWRLELETCWENSNGIVIWNHEPMRVWDPEAPWWLETLAFLNQHGLASLR